ncbi:hypothetical protein OQA88_1142 [Cercophora sp. LCS_1]
MEVTGSATAIVTVLTTTAKFMVLLGDVRASGDEFRQAQTKVDHLLGIINTHFDVNALNAMAQRQLQSAIEHDQQTLMQALSWVSNAGSPVQQARFKSLIHKDTGQWFINDPRFKDWLQNPGTTLLCPGIPGAGKTVMVAGVVDHVQSVLVNLGDKANLAYVYCDYKTEDTLKELLGDMIKQLVQHDRSLAFPLLDLHDRFVQHKILPTAEDMYITLELILLQQSAAHVIVDATDKVPQEQGVRRRFADMLARLKTKVVSLRLMVTSRPLPGITDVFKGVPTLEIRATDDDVGRYMDSKFEHFRTSKNIFLLARLLTEHFASLQMKRQINSLIDDLTTGLGTLTRYADLYTKFYWGTLERIEA